VVQALDVGYLAKSSNEGSDSEREGAGARYVEEGPSKRGWGEIGLLAAEH
jgi:hypothetical protein